MNASFGWDDSTLVQNFCRASEVTSFENASVWLRPIASLISLIETLANVSRDCPVREDTALENFPFASVTRVDELAEQDDEGRV